MLMHIFNVGVGMTFSGGLIDLTLFGVLQGNEKTNWIWIVIVGLFYAVLYYFTFYFLIKKLNYRTPGREEDGEESKLYTRRDLEARNAKRDGGDTTSELILSGLGGRENISDIDCCATRLRVTVKNSDVVQDEMLRKSGASGVIRKGNGVQIIYGPKVSVIRSRLEDYMHAGGTERSYAERVNEGAVVLYAHAKGRIVPLENVGDDAFAERILGDGVAIDPTEGKLFAPCDGRIEGVAESLHAVNLVSDTGYEILLHVGIDTVKLGGEYFCAHVKAGDTVKRGDLLLSFETEKIRDAGYSTVIPMVVCNADGADVSPLAEGTVGLQDRVLRIGSEV
jgi:PTS system D-glucosamine-specific IIC component